MPPSPPSRRPPPPAASSPATDSKVITLSRYRARLGRSQRGNRLESLLAMDDPEAAIAAMSGDEIYGILRENDFREASDLLRWVTPAQAQIVADFSLWSGDHTVPERLREWAGVMAELPEETIGAWVRGLDIELVALMLRKGARIYDLSVEDPPEESDGIFYPTPDRLFVLDFVGYRDPESEARAVAAAEAGGEIPDDGEETQQSAQALLRVVDQLYRDDHELARKILVGAKSELDSELEETAYRWRQGRMADHGFIDVFEALEVYQELDPLSVRLGEQPAAGRSRPIVTEEGPSFWLAPPALGPEMEEPGSLFVAAMGGVTDSQELDELHFSLVALANRVLSADRVDPADEEAAARVMARMRGLLDLAVEFLMRGAGEAAPEAERPRDPPARQGAAVREVDPRAVAAVRTVPLVRLFRLGVSLVGKVRALAGAWLRKGPFASLPELSLVEEPEAAVFAAVNRPRPVFPRLLDDPPAAGERPFAALDDMARATRMIQRAAAAEGMLVGLGVRPEHLTEVARRAAVPSDPAELDTGLLARTALIPRILQWSRSPGGATTANRAATPAAAAGLDEAEAAAQAPAFHPLSDVELRAFRSLLGGAGQAGTSPAGAGAAPPGLAEAPAWATHAAKILLGVAPDGLRVVADEVAARWIASLWPLESVWRQGDARAAEAHAADARPPSESSPSPSHAGPRHP